ncbi:hypothetical protein [Aggregatibacter kilianii]|uniref:hypothetical protein n=1 Tax=Aggregatibacter kilianii TaxID=2025884 RepID=UPI000D64F54F|nr:hypothetical protein [Aggregatibacter kilianii]
MHKYITKVTLCSSILLLSACGALPGSKTESAPGVVTEAAPATADVKALLQKAETLPTFEYVHNNTQYVAYLNGQPELIKVSQGSDNKFFFYKGGKVSVIQENGNVHHVEGANEGQKALVAEAAKLHKMLGTNSADKGAANVKTGNDAKLNYLCIAKIQQVAQTNRVFRSSANQANSDSRLTADVRLNGNQFYKMDCQLAGNRVAKLSLIKK